MSKVRLEIVALLALALLVASGILIWGERIGIDTEQAKGRWLSGLALGTLAVALLLSLDRFLGWSEVMRGLWRKLARQERAAPTTQGMLSRATARPQAPGELDTLRATLRLRYGLRWRYRQPWLLLIGDDAAIARLFPDAGETCWLLTADAVVLWARTGEDGRLDNAWLKQLARLRRRGPADAVVQVVGAATDAGQGAGPLPFAAMLAQLAGKLHWSAPVFVADVSMPAWAMSIPEVPVVGCDIAPDARAAGIVSALLALRDRLLTACLAQLPLTARERYLGELSRRLDADSHVLAERWATLRRAMGGRLPVRGIVFTPALSAADDPGANALWRYLGDAARRMPGRRTPAHPLAIGTGVALAATGLWTAGMLVSALSNAHEIRAVSKAASALQSAPDGIARLQALDSLQQQIQRYAYRVEHRSPLHTRFGLNRDADLLAALWTPYARSSRAMLVEPAMEALESRLAALAQLPADKVGGEAGQWAMSGRDALTAYLMLAHPERVESDLLARQLAEHWSTAARVTPGQKLDMAERFARFYADRLTFHPEWRIAAKADLVAGARQTLLAVIGQRNAVDTIYQALLDGAGERYPALSLAALTAGTDPRGLMRAQGGVDGVFTRQAYEGYVEAAIEKASRQQDVASDWVLADGHAGQTGQPGMAPDASVDALREALAERYFADYAEHWQQFANGLQWEPAATMPAVVDQLKLMADARQSPVIALMKSMAYQSGAGVRKRSLSDALVARAQTLIGKDDGAPGAVQPDPAGPLGAAFGPVLRLVGASEQAGATSGELSLQRYLDRVTAVRLRLQQMVNSPDADAQARQIALALFQGKGSDLAETQSYAQLMSASLGAEWAGMGDALFVRPIAQATHTVLQPAQASLDEAWRQAIALPWNQAFAGRYPFASTANDASVAELARYLRPRIGTIDMFLQAQLTGVLEQRGDRWVPVTSQQGLTFDPAFLRTLETLQRVGAHLLSEGDARYRFELKPIPTPGLTGTVLRLDHQSLHYFNHKESWQTMTWPADNLQEPGTLLQWQTEKAGTSAALEFKGRWGLVRMLERARVEPLDSATFQLTWEAAAPYPIRYQLRAEVGKGPLELLELRGLRMPERIFAGRTVPAPARPATQRREP